MDKEYYDTLVIVRMDRAKELLDEAKELLDKGSYKSANNRDFYAMERSIKALLAMEQIEVTTHNGGLKQFNYVFIYNGDGTFNSQDYQKIAGDQYFSDAEYRRVRRPRRGYGTIGNVNALGKKYCKNKKGESQMIEDFFFFALCR